MITLPVRKTKLEWPEEVLSELQRDELREAKTKYLPTPEEISQACEEIQAGWTEEERQSRKEAMPWQQLHDIICEQCGQVTQGKNADRQFCNSCARDRRNEHQRELRAARKAVAR